MRQGWRIIWISYNICLWGSSSLFSSDRKHTSHPAITELFLVIFESNRPEITLRLSNALISNQISAGQHIIFTTAIAMCWQNQKPTSQTSIKGNQTVREKKKNKLEAQNVVDNRTAPVCFLVWSLYVIIYLCLFILYLLVCAFFFNLLWSKVLWPCLAGYRQSHILSVCLK